MSKQFKGKTCVYCGREGSTADHIFARQLFPASRRDNLPQVCACSSCNRAKAALEHYALSVLPFGGQHPDSLHILETMVPRRLAKNRKLHIRLADGHGYAMVKQGDLVHRSMVLPIEPEKLFSLFAYVARGLVAHHWDIIVPNDYFVRAILLNETGETLYRSCMSRRSRAEARGNLGGGLILYQGAQALSDPCMTLWRFRLYGGVSFSGDPRMPEEASSDLWAATSRIPIPGFGD
jgi:hypothetical protein